MSGVCIMNLGVTWYTFLHSTFLRPLARLKKSRRLDELPEDVLILILSQCRIDDIFALRLTCSALRNVFSAYSTHIVPSVARCTFPRSELLLRNAECTFAWLKSLIPQQLASILVDGHRLVHYGAGWICQHGIPAEDAYGDELRAKVADGWHVLCRLSSIAKEVYKMDAKDILPNSRPEATWKLLHPPRYRAEVSRLREELVLQRRLQYIDSMLDTEAQNYVIMFTLLSVVFRVRACLSLAQKNDPPWVFDFGYGIDAPRLVRRGESWLTWFILDQGPQLFWEQWWALSPEVPETKHHVRSRALKAFFDKAVVGPEDVASYPQKEWKAERLQWYETQRSSARQVQRAIDEKSGGGFQYKHMVVFQQYIRQKDPFYTGLADQEVPPVTKETLIHVPFAVEFQAWDKL